MTAVLLLWMAALCGYDLRRRRLPNWLTLPGAAAVLGFATVTGQVPAALTGGAALFAVYAAVHLVQPSGLGAGDVKLALSLGGLTAMSGVGTWVLAAVGGPVLTAVTGLVALGIRSVRTVPHGPSMCLATAVALSLGA